MTCRDCYIRCYCFERSMEYPCKDFKPMHKATTKPNKTGENTDTSNYTVKNEASKNGVQSVTRANDYERLSGRND